MWWRVLLPLWVVLGHNILYLTVGFVRLSLAHDGATEVTIRQEHRGYRYQLAALGSFLIFADNVLRRLEGSGETIWAWVNSGRWELIFVSGILSVVLQLLFWSEVVGRGNRRANGE